MIFQICYNTDKYNDFYTKNEKYISQLDYKLYRDDDIEYFLNHYGYYDRFHKANVVKSLESSRSVILCDMLRVMILYEVGGTYIDSDTIFNDSIVSLEEDFSFVFGNRTVVTENRSLYFIKSNSKSEYIHSVLQKYLTRDELVLDVFMNPYNNMTKFRSEIAIVSHTTLSKYFNHKGISTSILNNLL